ncbi:MAG: LacI family DNA-binding transcriptional regulator [Clostridiaceae bacterium]|nr:LacI family DNA-binding transcriptional regulator [Clostridiaceae bacterium]
MAITVKDLADLCGVSRGTIDRALNNKPGINPDTRARILKTASDHGYTPDYIGRSLAKGRTFTLGVVVFDLNNPYFCQLLQAIEKQARQNGYVVMIMMSGQQADQEIKAVGQLKERRVDGLILHPVGCGPAYETQLAKTGLPIVVVGNRLSGCYDYVGLDNAGAAADAARLIAGRGYRRILFVAPPLRKAGQVNIAAQEQRLAGFLSVVQAQQLDATVISSADYLADLEHELEQAGPRTAVFCSSDVYALEVMQVLRKKKRRQEWPGGLMGFDGIDMLQYVQPRLTTVYNPVAETGKAAVDRLLCRIDDNGLAAETILIPHRILPGDSL